MKTIKLSVLTVVLALLTLTNCTHADSPDYDPVDPGVGESSDVLLVKKFSTAPTFDGIIDEVWREARPLLNAATVSSAGFREITLNSSSNGDLSLEPYDLMDPYTGESYKYSLRGGHDDEYLYLLFEWEDDTDSTDRQSWFFNSETSQWQQEK